MKCGCAEKDAYACKRDQVMYGLLFSHRRMTPRERRDAWALAFGEQTRCDCDCHDEHTRRAKRLKLKPEEKRIFQPIRSERL